MGIPQIRPFCGIRHAQLIQALFVVKDPLCAPAVGNSVLVFRVEILCHIHILRPDFLNVGNIIIIDLCQKVILDHALDGVVGGADNVIFYSPGLDDGIHFLIGFKYVIYYLDTCLFFKIIDHAFVDILPPVIYIELIVLAGAVLAAGRTVSGSGSAAGKGTG